MFSNIERYAFLKSLYQTNRDLKSMVSYFVLQNVSENFKKLENVKKELGEKFDIDIPLDSLKNSLRQLTK